MVRANLRWCHGVALTGILGLAACAHPPASEAPRISPVREHRRCAIDGSDRQWLEQALSNWRIVARDFLGAEEAMLPQIVVFDVDCTYSLERRPGEDAQWTITPHRGEIRLPNGAQIPSAPNAFNAAGAGGVNFVVMSLPSVWEAVAPPMEIPLGWFLEGIFFHELAHSYQAALDPAASFAALQREASLPPSVNDDSIQDRYRDDPAYVQAYERERDLLFRAAAAADSEARLLACEALAAMSARQGRYFTGAEAVWRRVDDLALTTEGLGQWVAYAWLTQRRGVDQATALRRLRGMHWSQEEGLALFLVIDRLVPDWRRRLLAPDPEMAGTLLARACRA